MNFRFVPPSPALEPDEPVDEDVCTDVLPDALSPRLERFEARTERGRMQTPAPIALAWLLAVSRKSVILNRRRQSSQAVPRTVTTILPLRADAITANRANQEIVGRGYGAILRRQRRGSRASAEPPDTEAKRVFNDLLRHGVVPDETRCI